MHKRSRPGRAILGVMLIALAVATSGCRSATSTSSPSSPSTSAASVPPSPSPSPPPSPSPTQQRAAPPPATSHEEFVVAACAAWEALFRAVGNPDTATGSDLSRALDEAVKAGDATSAERLAASITQELEVGRVQVAAAGGWRPQAPMMAQFDRVFAAYEARVAANLATARRDPNAVNPQAAFEAAGGVDAYYAMLALFPRTAPVEAKPCPGVPEVTIP